MYKYILSLFFVVTMSAFAMDVTIQGNQVISDEAIRTAGMFPDNENIDAWNGAVKKLYQTGWFDKITVTVEGSAVKIKVKEYPPLLAYKVESQLDQLKPEKIIEMLQDAGMVRGQPLPKHRLEQWRLGALQELKRMGYENSKVVVQTEYMSKGVVLVVTIDGGPLTLVRNIIITGQPVFSPKELTSILDVKPNSLWRRMDGANKISLEKNKLIEESVKRYYESQGYFYSTVKVTWNTVPGKSKNNYVDLVIHADAGRPAIIKNIQVVGECGELKSHMKQLEGKQYHADALQLQLMKSGLLREDFHVKLQPHLLDNGVEVILVCRSMPPMVISDIEIVGEGTDDLLLRKLLDFDVGDQWRGSWLASSKRRLLGQAYLEDANIVLKPGAKEGETEVVVTVEESKKNTMASFRMSYEQGGGGFGLGGGFSNRNFLGTGNALSLEAQYGEAMWFADLQLSQPLLPYQASALMGFTFRVTNQNKLNLGQYKQDLAAAYYGYRWLLSDQMLFQSQVSLKANHFVLYNENATNITDELNVFGYDPLEFAWSNTFVRDTRDRAERTTSGYVAKLGVSTIIPVLSDMMAYMQISPSFTAFYPVTSLFKQPVVLRGNVQTGYGYSYGKFSGSLPFYNRYYAGGIGTVRGYNLYSLGPYYVDEEGNQRATGGNWLLVGNLDLLLPSPYPDFLQPSLFIDAGNVYTNGITLDKLRYSTGLSTAINTPFAQLTVTFAKFMNAANEKHRMFTLEMGRQF